MRIECLFFGPFREDVGLRDLEYETDAATVGDLLADLEAEFPVLEGRLLAGDGLAGETVVTKNKRDVRHLEGLGTALEAGDVFRLVPSVYGGTGGR